MRMKGLPLLTRRLRSGRLARRVLVGLALSIGILSLYSGVLVWRAMNDGIDHGGGGRPHGSTTPDHDVNTPHPDHTLPPPYAHNPEAAPYTESLEELVRLLRIYAEQRGVTVNHSFYAPLEAIAGAAYADADVVKADLALLGAADLLHGVYKTGDAGHLSATWMLDDPAAIAAEQEAYVERHLAPTLAEAELTPLRVIAAYYSGGGGRGSLHRVAAETETAMNDDGYTTYIQRSAIFYDVANAARRGYGLEGSVFVAVPFTLADVTDDVVAAIRRRAATNNTQSVSGGKGGGGGGGGDDDDGDDGFKEVRLTATRCAATVESLLRQAHHSAAVAVGTVDVVVVSGVDSPQDLRFNATADVLRPLRAVDRAKLSSTRRRRYTRLTCEPPDFMSGWDDASYVFRWKDNLRRRRVVVPLTRLASAAESTAALERRFAIAHVGRYAALQLYRGESYVLLLGAGALMLPNWDLTLRLLYLRTPMAERAVLTSRPTPGVAWPAVAVAVAREWSMSPWLLLHPAQTTPELGVAGKRLLAALPADVSAWVEAAHAEAALVLWLVTPTWLWPTMVEVLTGWKGLADGAAEPPSPPASGILRSFATAVLRDVLGDAAPTFKLAEVVALHTDTNTTTTTTGAPGAATSPTPALVRVRGGASAATQGLSPAFVAESLTVSEVMEMLFLAEVRPPMPAKPMVEVVQTASTSPPLLPPRQPGNADAAALCGEAGSDSPYYSPATQMLLKRSFEVCWLMGHRRVVRQTSHRLVAATASTTVLTPTAAAMCSARTRFAAATVVPRTSAALADMRYMLPAEATPATRLSTVTPGEMRGVPTPAHSTRTGAAEELQRNGPAGAALAEDTTPTPFVLQAVASAELLFGRAELFFHYAPKHRLRTRPRTLAEQLAKAEAPEHTPEAVELDATLQYLGGPLEDLYTTQLLWTRGWNMFGLTEPVAVAADDAGVPAPPASDDVSVCTLEADDVRAAPPEMSAAHTFTHDKFWALVMEHRSSGTPLGASTAAAAAADAVNASTLHPLRRSVRDWESFAKVDLDAVRSSLRAS